MTLSFPLTSSSELLDEHPGPSAPGISLRRAEDTDLAFLQDIYAQSRADEVAAMPWPEAARRAFCDSQFALQHRHYVTQYPHGDFLIVQHDGSAIGRLYLCRQVNELWLIDILLDHTWHGRGVGSALLIWMRELIASFHLNALRLHVLQQNHQARRLYQRHGFLPEANEGAHLRMVWPCASVQENMIS